MLVLAGASPPPPRVFKLLEYLPELGWNGTLLTPRLDGDTRFAAAATPSYSAIATPFLPTPSRLLVDRRLAAKATRAPLPTKMASAMRVMLQWLNTPDDLVGWLPWAVGVGRRLFRQGKVDAIIASGPPFTTMLAGALLQRHTGVPLIADLRDAWTQDPFDPCGAIGGSFRATVGSRRVRAQRAIERFCLSRALLTSFTSDPTHAAYAAAYPGLADRFLVAYNGIDERDFDVAPERGAGFQSVYIGTLHEYQLPDLETFLEGFALARAEGKLSEGTFIVAGYRSPAVDGALTARIRELGLSSVVELMPAIEHRRAMALMKGADVILMLTGENRFTRLSKVSDGLAVGKPLLGLAPEGSETATHLRAQGHRVIAEPSATEVARALVELRAAPVPAGGEFPFPYPHKLHWRSTATALIERIDRGKRP